MTTVEHMLREVVWYQQHGKYRERIRKTNEGELYVVGDWSWNRNHPDKHEEIEPQMESALGYSHDRS